ncbi:Chromosome transmission fidelity protein 8 [Escovopsis weberi]|uniref:Chromosome transmission fidelity protein 8 n=1 Tax=Escovopsis weberi TaxID=150374 RepID=A0A0M9VWL2_ESCWE|nr:Chromosome transmission fidelity protein 8 [Escovopsis weberi]
MASSAPVMLHPPSRQGQTASPSALPQLLQTPSGLAILELQGTVNLPYDSEGETLKDIHIGRIEFPDYSPDAIGSGWMKRVFMYVGQHQRLIGEVKKLPKAIAVVRKRQVGSMEGLAGISAEGDGSLEVVEIVTHKLMFSGRPEPVGTAHSLV